jgi:DNA recombination protein RmuC
LRWWSASQSGRSSAGSRPPGANASPHRARTDRAVHAERLTASGRGNHAARRVQALSADALRTNNQAFLDLAETRLRDARTEATADMEARKKAIETLLAPMATTLEQVDREIRESERRRVESGAELMQRIASLDTTGQDLRGQTARLVDALKRPGVRGRWGELQLKRVIELAGMVEHCDFEEQRTLTSDERRMRPDVIVRLPGGKFVVIDAKAPLDAYLKALEAPDEGEPGALLDHAKQVRTHLSQLAAKGYAAHVHPSPDLRRHVSAGRNVFSAALEQDPRSSSSESGSSSTSFRQTRQRSCAVESRRVRGGSNRPWKKTRGKSAISGAACTVGPRPGRTFPNRSGRS